jgi:hypothetical protein
LADVDACSHLIGAGVDDRHARGAVATGIHPTPVGRHEEAMRPHWEWG